MKSLTVITCKKKKGNEKKTERCPKKFHICRNLLNLKLDNY